MVKVIEGYILNEVIGEGNFGLVYRATHKEKPDLYAVKVIPNEKFQENDKLGIYTNNQIQALKTIGISDYIIRFYTMIKSKSNCYLVYEYCNGGTLLSLLRKQQKLQQKKALLIFKQLLEAFKVLNKYSIMHRDLKPENIFFTSQEENQNDKKKVKLGDFGFCKGLKPDENLAKTMLGSPIYMAPQVLKGESYTTKADIWSLGVILFQMLYGYCPFESRSIASLISTIDTQPVQLPTNIPVSQKTQTLIKRMLAKDYFRRIGWVELFGIKIDDNGQYIEEPPTTNTNEDRSSAPGKNKFSSLFGSLSLGSASIIPNSRSYSIIKEDQNDKSKNVLKSQIKLISKKGIEQSNPSTNILTENRVASSQPKDQKRFYSQNYMSILSTPLSLKKIQDDQVNQSKQKLKQLQKTVEIEPNKNRQKEINQINVKSGGNSVPSSPPILYREQRLTSMDNLDLVREQNIGANSNNSTAITAFNPNSNVSAISNQQTAFNKYRQNIGMGSNLSNKFLSDRSIKESSRHSTHIANTVNSQISQNSEIDTKRNNLLKLHESITKTLTKTLILIQQKYSSYKISKDISDLNLIRDLLQDCYIVLKMVQQKLKCITQSIKITETSLLDMASIINYEHIQVQKFIIEMRNQLIRCSMELPNIPTSLQTVKCDRNENMNSFKELIRTRQVVQVIDDNF